MYNMRDGGGGPSLHIMQFEGQRKRSWADFKSFFPYIALILLFSFGLASYSLLSHFRSPALKQPIGWQSWDVIQVKQVESEGEWSPSIPIHSWVGDKIACVDDRTPSPFTLPAVSIRDDRSP